MDTVNAQVVNFIAEEIVRGRQTGDFSEEVNLIEQGILDSLSILKLVSFLEKQFGIKVEDIDLLPENFESVALIGDFVRARTSA